MNEQEQAAFNARLMALVENIDSRLDNIEPQIISLVGKVAAIEAAQDSNKKKPLLYPISFMAFVQHLRILDGDFIS